MLMEPSKIRERLVSGIFILNDTSDSLGRLEEALKKVVAAEPIEQKLREAVRSGRLSELPEDELLEAGFHAGIITREESACIHEAIVARGDVIRVDDFDHIGGKAEGAA
jgi:acyl-CoA dehydrogenase